MKLKPLSAFAEGLINEISQIQLRHPCTLAAGEIDEEATERFEYLMLDAALMVYSDEDVYWFTFISTVSLAHAVEGKDLPVDKRIDAVLSIPNGEWKKDPVIVKVINENRRIGRKFPFE